jgi:hypothetical protein
VVDEAAAKGEEAEVGVRNVPVVEEDVVLEEAKVVVLEVKEDHVVKEDEEQVEELPNKNSRHKISRVMRRILGRLRLSLSEHRKELGERLQKHMNPSQLLPRLQWWRLQSRRLRWCRS